MTDRDIIFLSIGLLAGLIFAGLVWLMDLQKRSNMLSKGDRRHDTTTTHP